MLMDAVAAFPTGCALLWAVGWAISLLLSAYAIARLLRRMDRLKAQARENSMFRDMIDLVKDVAVTAHALEDGARVLYANDAACLHFGVSRETLLTWRPPDWNPHFDAERVEALNRPLKSGDTLVIETEHRVASGELVPVEVMLLCQVRDGIRIAIAYTRDIRARKAENARHLQYERHEAETKFRTVFESANDGIFLHRIVERNGRIEFILHDLNRKGCELWGHSREDILSGNFDLLAMCEPPYTFEEATRRNRLAAAGQAQLFDWQLKRGDGSKIWGEVNLRHIRIDRDDFLLAVMRDITERKRMEQALLASKREFQALAENLPDSIIRYDRDGLHAYLNPSARQALAFMSSALPEMTADELWATPSGAFVHRKVRQVLETASPVEFEFVADPFPGKCAARIYQFHIVPECDGDGRLVGALGLAHDISKRKALEEVLRDREAKYKALAESVAVVSWEFDLVNDKWTYVAPQSLSILGYAPEEWTDFNWWAAHIFEDDRENAVRHCREETKKNKNHVFEYRFVKKDGSMTWVQDIVNVFVENDVPVILRGVIVDIDQRKQLEQKLQKREVLFRELVENSPDTIARYDRHCRRVYANPTLVAAMGGDLGRVLGTTPAEFPGGAFGQQYQEAIREVLLEGKERSFEMRWQVGEHEACAQIRLSPEFDAFGQAIQVLALGRDITEIDQYRKKIHRQAFSDALTGLPNRTLLSDRIRQTIADAAYHGQQFGLMMLDLDHFKEINDSMGHGVGDQLLCAAAARLLDCVRSYDTVARLGGDEFAVLLPEVRDVGDLGTIAGKMLHAVARPFDIGGKELFISASIGIALYPGDSGEIDTLLKYADSAMYQAKKQGRNNFQFYAKEFTAGAIDRLEMVAALRKACQRHELELYYQPQIDLPTGRVIGAEALLRWHRPDHGMVMPDQFIPAAEDSGLIVEIGEWVLSSACAAAVEWNRGRAVPFKVAVNVSARQFIGNDLVGSVRAILAATGCQPEWLALEITESLLLEDSHETISMLQALNGMGLSISIDDFGIGHCALSYLSRFPVSQIKIDRSFVSDIPANREKCALIKAILSIAAALRLESVSEGVEHPAQAEYLMAHGCRSVQGYLFGRPMPRIAFQTLLAEVDEDIAESGSMSYT